MNKQIRDYKAGYDSMPVEVLVETYINFDKYTSESKKSNVMMQAIFASIKDRSIDDLVQCKDNLESIHPQTTNVELVNRLGEMINWIDYYIQNKKPMQIKSVVNANI